MQGGNILLTLAEERERGVLIEENAGDEPTTEEERKTREKVYECFEGKHYADRRRRRRSNEAEMSDLPW